MKKRSIDFREYFLLDISAVIRFLTLSDIVWNGATGLLGPIFAIFIVDYIDGGSAAVAGVAATVYLVTKSLFQVPVASFIDRVRGERDDYEVLVIGTFLGSLVPLAYLFIHTPLQLYIVEFVYGLIIAATFPSYMAVFTRHMDKQKEGTEWGVYFTLTDLSSAGAAVLGGVLADTLGFRPLIIMVVVVSLFAATALLPLKRFMRMPRR